MRKAIVISAVAVMATACAEPKAVADASRADPNKPAVLQYPPVILPSDTAKPDTMPEYMEKIARAKSEILPEYSLITAASVMGDRRTLGAELADDVVIKMAGVTLSGRDSAVAGLVLFARRNSLREILRQSHSLNAIGTTYTDSGAYLMVAQRGVAKPVEQRGTYVTVWRRGSGTEPKWQMVSDELTPDPAPKKR
jgi:hypothetical protein